MNRASGVRVLQQQGARSPASGDASKPGLQSWANQNRAAACGMAVSLSGWEQFVERQRRV